MQVIEKFVSINGEGLKQGELAVFIRFKGCNLRCSYCDTRYSFENPEYTDESIDDIVKYCLDSKVKNITLTGGEPLLQDDIDKLMIELSKNGFNIEIETNGAINIEKFKDIANVSFTLDYKLPISLMESQMITDNYRFISKKDSVKFVCGSHDDLERMLVIINKYDLINKTNCIISPVFNMIKLEDIVDFMIKNNLNGVRFSLQIHKVIWDPNRRGV
ncbi:MAG: putative 7-carboxy-7-deazaguanine synthase QueE [Acholeplasmatales bacterium]|nr:putative 7-carboxy-7-deazaguanine synthase QueE [Acholeplasmatales bacterium]